ncbi:MAG: hypothetical protein KJP18_13985, partial [Gemmatimonadetes bacterium]|nr:hypothetical protein [Gemmatimonadota bacterium]
YRARCPAEYWDYTPVLTVDYLVFQAGAWEDDPDELAAMLPVIRNVAAEAEAYAKQLFPIADIRSSSPRVVPLAGGQRPSPGCTQSCFGAAVDAEMKAQSNADIVVGFVAHDLRSDEERAQSWMGLTGGNTSSELVSGQGAVVSLVGPSAEFFPRYVNALVHDWGHVLDLEHLPAVDAEERARAMALRGQSTPIEYKGIEGFRLTPAGDAGWNKSSREGNEEGPNLAPLMFPGTMPAHEAFIANHHYRRIQALFERLNWSRNAGG